MARPSGWPSPHPQRYNEVAYPVSARDVIMPMLSSRFLPIATAFLLATAATDRTASAQATINLTTPNGNCVAVTDQNGLRLAPGGTDLVGTGVSLTAQQPGACNPAGGASSSFDAVIQTSGSATPGTPFTPTVGTPFYVIWSASADAQACTLGGNFTSGISGWAIGSSACTTSCPGTHTTPVTPTAGGAYSFSVTCTNASGFAATPAVNVSGPATPAPTPNPIPLTVPASAFAGTAFTVTWPVMQNAARCVGTGTFNGTPVANLGDWTTVTTVSNTISNARNVTVPTASGAGSLALTLTCYNADSSATAIGQSSAIAVTVAPAGACPASITTSDGARTLLLTSGISYGVYPGIRPNVNLSQWDNIWGHNSTTDGTTPWPGVGGSSPVIRSFGRSQYVGAHFKTRSSVTGLSGGFSNPSFAAGPNITMAISTACGDFSANLPTAGCLRADVPTADANLVQWKFSTNAPGSYCNLQPNTDYYVNIMLTDHLSTTECSANATTCFVAPVSYSGN